MSPSPQFKRMIANIKDADNLVLTPSVDQWLVDHPEGVVVGIANAERLAELVMTQPRQRSGSFSGSSAGLCERRQLFRFYGAESYGTVNSVLQNIFNDGHWRHLRWQMMLLEAGLLEDIEVPVEMPEYRVKGSMDGVGVSGGERFMFELKGWSAVVHEPVEKHLMQIHRYLLMSGLKRCVLIYENKSTQDWKEFIVDRDEEIIQRVISELVSLNHHVDEGTFPPILKGCKMRDATYKQCPYREVCFAKGEN